MEIEEKSQNQLQKEVKIQKGTIQL